MSATDNFPIKKDNNFISSINGNIVHVTVNNFITTDKKPFVGINSQGQNNSHGNNPYDNSNSNNSKGIVSRPYSSDNKERGDVLNNTTKPIGSKNEVNRNLFSNYDNTAYGGLYGKSSPYDGKITNKLASTVNKPVPKK
jgi:hypothetical protein